MTTGCLPPFPERTSPTMNTERRQSARNACDDSEELEVFAARHDQVD